MASDVPTTRTMSVGVGDAYAAELGVEALLAAGVPRDAITVGRPAITPHSRYLWRIVISIVLWSVLGGAIGAVVALVLATAGIGPAGTTGAIVQIVTWVIAGHLLAGLWTGYALLADRTHREMAPDRASETGATITVRCRSEEELQAVRRTLGEMNIKMEGARQQGPVKRVVDR